MVPALTLGVALATGRWCGLSQTKLVPALDLTPSPSEMDISEHGFALASHSAFGASLDFSRRQINGTISGRVEP
jgi:hypothetical protein